MVSVEDWALVRPLVIAGGGAGVAGVAAIRGHDDRQTRRDRGTLASSVPASIKNSVVRIRKQGPSVQALPVPDPRASRNRPSNSVPRRRAYLP